MISKDAFVSLFKKETTKTLNVMRAFPPDKGDFKPHERSSTALQLTSTFVFEMYLLKMHILGEPIDRSIFKTYKPEGMNKVIEDFEKETALVLKGLEQLPDSGFSSTVTFAGNPFPSDEFAMMMLHDQIHHRGQLSVYVRMAGGKVPAIYGPSADDPKPVF